MTAQPGRKDRRDGLRARGPAPGGRAVAPARAPARERPADRAPGLAQKLLAHCEAHREVTTRKGAKTFQVKVTAGGLTVSRPAEVPIVFPRVELERILRAILELRAARAPMTVENLKAYAVGPEGLYVWGILGHMNAQPG
ncbi:MAG TPA: hypothetical protein VM286_07475 [Candidatus Thermoplasmatota archaeon]|nr:hypothetical protein [Candidatus Thermoplasmatota archaeon]